MASPYAKIYTNLTGTPTAIEANDLGFKGRARALLGAVVLTFPTGVVTLNVLDGWIDIGPVNLKYCLVSGNTFSLSLLGTMDPGWIQ